jgi:AraC-like DNA-binding protein
VAPFCHARAKGGTLVIEIALTMLRVAAGLQLLILAYLIGFSANPKRVRVLGATLFIGFSWDMLVPVIVSDIAPAFGLWFMYPAGLIVSGLLLFVCVLFEDDLPIPLWVKLAVMIDIAVSLLLYVNLFGFADYAFAGSITAVIKLCMVGGSIYIVLRGRTDDLIRQRADLRLFLIWSIAWSTVPLLLAQLFSISYISAAAYMLVDGAIFFNTSALLIAFIKLNPDFELVRQPVLVAQTSIDGETAYLIDRVSAERLYSNHSLRLKTLAQEIGWSESRLRQTVNQDLGYRSFNQFINRFRLDDACVDLLVESDKDVLEVALDVGFRSISSFNLAFHAHFGVNPIEYRRANKNL